MKRVVVAASLALVLAGSVSAEEFYKWKDQSGVWQYTQTPPPAGAEMKTVSIQPGPTPELPVLQPNQIESPGQASNADKAAADPAMTADIRAKRQQACDDARMRSDKLLNSPLVSMDRNRDGTPESLSVEEQSAELSRAQQAVRLYCNG